MNQAYQQASDYRKSLEKQYEQPVNMDSRGMALMEEAAWLKSSATENLNGVWKTLADGAIDVGQDIALSPLLMAGPGAYAAGVAANAAAEDMYEQTASGKKASGALGSGLITAGVEIAADKIKLDKVFDKVPVNKMLDILNLSKGRRKAAEIVLKDVFPNVSDAGVSYFLEYLADEARHDPEAEFNFEDFLQYIATNGAIGLFEGKATPFYDEVKRVWNSFG